MPQVIHPGPSKKYYDSSSSSSDSDFSSSSDSSLSDYDYKHRHHKKRSSRQHRQKAPRADRVVVTEAIIDKNGKRTEILQDRKGRVEKSSKHHVSAKTRLERPHYIKGLLADSAQVRGLDSIKVLAADLVLHLAKQAIAPKSDYFDKPTFHPKEVIKDIVAGVAGDLGVRGPSVVKRRKHGRPQHKQHHHRRTHRY